MEPTSNADFMFFGIGIGIIFLIHFVPSFIAFSRKHPSRKLILIINILMGWTIIGWVALMYWVTRDGARKALA